MFKVRYIPEGERKSGFESRHPVELIKNDGQRFGLTAVEACGLLLDLHQVLYEAGYVDRQIRRIG